MEKIWYKVEIVMRCFLLIFSIAMLSSVFVFADTIFTINCDGVFQFGDVYGEQTIPGKLELYQNIAEYQAAYDVLYKGLTTMQKEIVVDYSSSVNENTIKSIYETVVNDNPILFYVMDTFKVATNKSEVIVWPDYGEEAAKRKLDFEEKIDFILSSVVCRGMTDVDKVLALHDYLVLNCKYDVDIGGPAKASFRADGAILDGKAVCQGYALAMKHLLKMVGIENVLVPSNEMNHIWNALNIEGMWYHLDATWDDPLINGNDCPGTVYHNYFLVSDNQIAGGDNPHYGWDSSVSECTSQFYESGYIFNGSNSAFYFNDGLFWYIKGKDLVRSDIKGVNNSIVKHLDTVDNLGMQMYDGFLYFVSGGDVIAYDIKSDVLRVLNEGNVALRSLELKNGVLSWRDYVNKADLGSIDLSNTFMGCTANNAVRYSEGILSAIDDIGLLNDGYISVKSNRDSAMDIAIYISLYDYKGRMIYCSSKYVTLTAHGIYNYRFSIDSDLIDSATEAKVIVLNDDDNFAPAGYVRTIVSNEQ